WLSPCISPRPDRACDRHSPSRAVADGEPGGAKLRSTPALGAGARQARAVSHWRRRDKEPREDRPGAAGNSGGSSFDVPQHHRAAGNRHETKPRVRDLGGYTARAGDTGARNQQDRVAAPRDQGDAASISSYLRKDLSRPKSRRVRGYEAAP